MQRGWRAGIVGLVGGLLLGPCCCVARADELPYWQRADGNNRANVRPVYYQDWEPTLPEEARASSQRRKTTTTPIDSVTAADRFLEQRRDWYRPYFQPNWEPQPYRSYFHTPLYNPNDRRIRTFQRYISRPLPEVCYAPYPQYCNPSASGGYGGSSYGGSSMRRATSAPTTGEPTTIEEIPAGPEFSGEPISP